MMAMPAVGLVVMPAALIAVILMPFGIEILPLTAMDWGLDWMIFVAERTAAWSAGLGNVPRRSRGGAAPRRHRLPLADPLARALAARRPRADPGGDPACRDSTAAGHPRRARAAGRWPSAARTAVFTSPAARANPSSSRPGCGPMPIPAMRAPPISRDGVLCDALGCIAHASGRRQDRPRPQARRLRRGLRRSRGGSEPLRGAAGLQRRSARHRPRPPRAVRVTGPLSRGRKHPDRGRRRATRCRD